MQGIFIDFEGIDGSGKGSLIGLLIEKLASLGITPVMGKEPGGTPLGLKIRELLFKDPTTHAMAPSVCDCLFLADHIQHVEKVIKPTLAAGRVIISDRYAYTEFAYACDREVHPLIDQAYHDLIGPVPDIIFLLGGTPENLLERAQGRTEETHQAGKKWNNADSQRRIQDTYLRQLIPMPQTVWVDTDVLTPEVLFERYLWPPVERLLAMRESARMSIVVPADPAPPEHNPALEELERARREFRRKTFTPGQVQ